MEPILERECDEGHLFDSSIQESSDSPSIKSFERGLPNFQVLYWNKRKTKSRQFQTRSWGQAVKSVLKNKERYISTILSEIDLIPDKAS